MKIPFGAFPRLATIGLAGWLWISCFIWERTANTTLVIGLIMVACIMAMELMSFVDNRVRFGSTILGALLIGVAFTVGHTWGFLRWHDAAIGALIMLLSLVPNPMVPADPEPERATPASH